VVDQAGRAAQGQTLFDTRRLRVLAKPYGVQKIDAGPKLMNITFKPNPPIDAMHIIGNDKLRIEREIAEPRDRAQFVRDTLRALGQPVVTG
jgi:transcription-repair coupling factor (superfamily II helicase)